MSGLNREVIRRRLEALAARHGGRLTPEQVVEDARNKKSPLHDYFTWDDREAAEKQRLYEARDLIRSVRVTTVVNETVHRVIAYVRDPRCADAKEQGYISTDALRTDSDLARAALVEEFSRAAAAMRRALAVAEALGLHDQVQEQVLRIEALKDRVEARV